MKYDFITPFKGTLIFILLLSIFGGGFLACIYITANISETWGVVSFILYLILIVYTAAFSAQNFD